MSKTYGYIRVSSRDQNEDRQRIAMAEAGVEPKSVFMDKQSGKSFDLPLLESRMILNRIRLKVTQFAPSRMLLTMSLSRRRVLSALRP